MRLAYLSLILSGVSFLFADNPRSFGQQPQPATVEENLSESARVDRNRNHETQLTTARRHLRSGQFTQAIGVLSQILNSAQDGFVVTDAGRYVNAKTEANRLIAAMPPPALRDYQQQFGQVAGRRLDAARFSGDVQRLIDVADQFRNTAAGRQALRQLAMQHFDHGHFFAAAAAFRDVLAHPLTKSPAEPMVITPLIVSLARCGDHRGARTLFQQHRQLFSSHRLQIGGRPVPLGDWLRRQLDEPSNQPERGAWKSFSSTTGSVLVADASTPSVQSPPRWQREIGLPKSVAGLIDAELAELERHGITRLCSFRPLVIGDVVVVRSIDHLTALERPTGKVIWSRRIGSPVAKLSANLKRLKNDGLHDMISRSLVRRLQADTLWAALSSDGARLFAVVENERRNQGPLSAARNPFAGTPRADGDQQKLYSSLVAFDLPTGRELWQIGGPNTMIGDDDSFGTVSFLGAPLVLDGSLYVVGRTSQQMRLFAIEAVEGTLLWSQMLAHRSGSRPSAANTRGVACPVAFAGGMLVCSTAAGTMVGVDLVTRTPRWAYRFPRDDISHPRGLPLGRSSQLLHDRWWRGWRAPSVFIDDGRVLIATPESDTIHALDLQSGRQLWRQPRRGGLYLAGTAGGRLIVVEKYFVRSLNLGTGETIWTARVGLASGHGVLSSSQFLLPLSDGGVASILLNDGTFRRTFPVTKAGLGNLTAAAGRILAQTADRVALLHSLDSQRAGADESLRQKPDDLATLLKKGLLDREAGDFQTAEKVFRALPSAAASEPMRNSLRELLTLALRAQPAKANQLAARLEPLIETTEQRIEFLYALSNAYRQQDQRLSALDASLRLIDLTPTGERRAGNGPYRRVRFDRLLQGEIADLLAAAGPDVRHRLEQQIEERLQRALESSDPFALQRFSDQFSRLRWGQHVRTRQTEKSSIGVGFLRSQLNLIELTALDRFSLSPVEQRTAATAMGQLAALMETHSYGHEAAGWYRRLRDEFPDVRLDVGRTPAELIASLPIRSRLAEEIRSGPTEVWPAVQPNVTVESAKNPRWRFIRVPVEASPGSLYERVSVYVDRSGKRLRFQGGTQSGFWELALPASAAQFRGLPQLYGGWGVGQLLVLKLGTELFGIASLNRTGEKQARLLWQTDTLAGRRLKPNDWEARLQTARRGFGVDSVLVLDRFGREPDRVGPVRVGYMCYHDRGRLVAMESATAARLWQRDDIPAGTVTVGDDEYVVMYRLDSLEIEVLRALDGKTVKVHRLAVWPRDFLMQQGRYALAATQEVHAQRFRQIDLVSGRSVWERGFSREAVPFRIDGQKLGIVRPDGRIDVVRLRDGTTLTAHPASLPDRWADVFSIIDEHSFYVVVSGPFADQNSSEATNHVIGLRTRAVNGRLFAFDRRSGRLKWQTVLEDCALDLDQPLEAPFLIGSFWRLEKSSGRVTRRKFGIFCIDKRTGRRIYEQQETATRRSTGHWALKTDIDQGWIELKTEQKTASLDFTR